MTTSENITNAAPTKLIRDGAGKLFLVAECADPALSHVYYGYPVKKQSAGYAILTSRGNGKPRLIRKVGTTVVEG